MKIQYVLPIALLAWSPAILEVNANDGRVETLTARKDEERDAPLAAALLNANKDHRQEVMLLPEEDNTSWWSLHESMSYSYEPSAAPTKSAAVTTAPTTTEAPSKSPSKSPSNAPSKAPTKAPVTSSPTKIETTTAPVAVGSCTDSGTQFLLTDDWGVVKLRGCDWVGNNINQIGKRCGYNNIESHCPNTCGACAAFSCADSERQFVKWGNKNKLHTCEWVKQSANAKLITKRCDMTGFTATCRETCKYVGNGLSC